MFWKVRSPERPVPQVGWTCAWQRAAVLRPPEAGPHAAAARIQCRFCASADIFGGFWDDSASECFWEFRTWWEGVEKLLTCCWRISCWPSRHDMGRLGLGMHHDAPGIAQVFANYSWLSSGPPIHIAATELRGVTIEQLSSLQLGIEIVLRTLFCMAYRLGGLCWSCFREIWAGEYFDTSP